MKQETRKISKEVILKIARIQSELDEIKNEIGINDSELEKEMKMWEEAGTEDLINWEKENLQDE